MLLRMELMQNVLRTLDGPGHQLGIIHHVERQITKVTFRLLVPPVYLDGVTERLEGVKRQPNGENDRKIVDGIVPADKVRQRCQVFIGKVEVLEKYQHPDVGQNTGNQHPAFFLPFKFFQAQSCKVIDGDRHCQNEDIVRDERHVEIAAGG